MNGNYIIIRRCGKAIAGTKSDVIKTAAKTIEKSSPTSGLWEEFVAGRKSWSFSVNYLITNVNGVADEERESFGIGDLLTVGTKYTIDICANSVVLLSGEAICESCDITARTGALIQGIFSFKGTGALQS
jgi:predicted secreted protein